MHPTKQAHARNNAPHLAPDLESGLDNLSAAISERTGGKLLGEMTSEEFAVAFSAGPIMFRNGEVVEK